jgi:hypothetical protein
MPEQELLQIGAVAILFFFAIKEFFAYLKIKKEMPNKPDISKIEKDIALINQQLNNHMTDYNKCINRTESLVEKNSESIDEIKTTLIRLEAIVRK